MRKIYDKETLDKIHKYELEILRDFIKVCEENNLTYFGFGGTGIGALRHGGFIPWDDDIDLAIPRDDYNKVVEIFERDYSDKYIIVNSKNFDQFPGMNTHITLKNTKFITEDVKDLDYPQGIFLDIFPIDNAPDGEKEFKKHATKAWFLSKLLIMRHVPFPVLPYEGLKGKLIHFVTMCIWAFMCVFRISHKFLYEKINKVNTKYNNVETKAYGYFCGTKPDNNFFVKKDIFPLRKIKFEDVEINFPNNIEEILTGFYGDFMKIPPEEQRINHCPLVIEFPNND